MIYIGIDPGRRTGWALIDEDGARLESGAFDSPGPRWHRAWQEEVKQLVYRVPSGHAYTFCFEHVTFHRGKAWAELYFGMKALLLGFADAEFVTPAQVKETGGSRFKNGLMENAIEHWELGEDYPIDDNEADALWIAETVRRRNECD